MKATFYMLALTIAVALPAAAQDLGMVADGTSASVTVFDGDTNQVWGTVALPGMYTVALDCVVAPDQTLGFVTAGNSQVYVVDLTQRPPVLAGGMNPIPIGNYGSDAEITPGGELLVVCAGKVAGPMSIVDVASRTVINNFAGADDEYAALDIDANGRLLAYAFNGGAADARLLLFTLDHNGQLFLQDFLKPTFNYSDICFAPGGQSFAATDYAFVTTDSYTTTPIAFVQAVPFTLPSAGYGTDCDFRPQGDVLFTRPLDSGSFAIDIDAYAFNPATGQINEPPLFTITNIFDNFLPDGVDTFAVNRAGDRVYVPQVGGVEIFDADPLGTGQHLGTIPAALVDPTGIAFSRWPQVFTPMAELGIINLTAVDVFAGGATNDRVTGKGTMELAPGADPFDPWTDNVYVELNDLHFVIPAGSFVEHETFGITWWGYAGTVYNDVFNGTVSMQISFEHSTNWQIKTLGLDTSSAVDNPAVLKIRIGDNTGEFPFAWEQQIHHGAGDYSRYTL